MTIPFTTKVECFICHKSFRLRGGNRLLPWHQSARFGFRCTGSGTFGAAGK